MKYKLLIFIFLSFLLKCGSIQVKNNNSTISGNTKGTNKPKYDFATGVYTEWYNNGQIKLKVSQPTGQSPNSFPKWAPFDNNGIPIGRVKLKKGVLVFQFDEKSKKLIPISQYNLFEGWFPNGKKMFELNCKEKKYIEY